MSYQNLVPAVESEAIIRERDKFLVFGSHCTRKYEGEIKNAGDTITVYVEGNPTIYVLETDGTYTANGTDYNGTKMSGNVAGKGSSVLQNGIPDAETVPFGEITLQVKKTAIFNVAVGDYDQKLASKKGLMGMIRRSIGKRIADMQDAAIAATIFNYTGYKKIASVYNGTDKVVAKDEAGEGEVNVLDLVDKVVEEFNNRNINDTTKFACECSPKFWRITKRALRSVDTDNSGILANRKCPVYNDIYFTKTVNAKDSAGTEHVVFRTLDSVAFFDPFMHIEAYRPDNGFKDCLKGYQLFDCGIVKPNEIIKIEPAY